MPVASWSLHLGKAINDTGITYEDLSSLTSTTMSDEVNHVVEYM